MRKLRWLALPLFTSCSFAEYARGCYGDCGESGLSMLLIAPLVYVYLRFWNRQKGGPTAGSVALFFCLSLAIALGTGFFAMTWLDAPAWLGLALEAIVGIATFTYLVHPSRYPSDPKRRKN